MTKESEEYKTNEYFIKYAVERDKIRKKYKDVVVGISWLSHAMPTLYSV